MGHISQGPNIGNHKWILSLTVLINSGVLASISEAPLDGDIRILKNIKFNSQFSRPFPQPNFIVDFGVEHSGIELDFGDISSHFLIHVRFLTTK